MNPDELKLLDETLLGLAEVERGGDLTSALDAFGWRDVLAAEPRAAIVSRKACNWCTVSVGDSYKFSNSRISDSVKPSRLPRSVSFNRVRSRLE